MNLNDISTQLLFTTVPIWCFNAEGARTAGTGFILSLPHPDLENRQLPLLVTNKHVVANAVRGFIALSERDGDNPKQGPALRIEIPGTALTSNLAPEDDLAIVPIGQLLNQLERSQNPVFFRSVTDDIIPKSEVLQDLAAIEEITFIGYPSGLYDQINNSPIVRRGITATPPWNDFNGEPAFLIDAGVFPGSSGSPVFILNQGSYSTRNGINIGSRLLFMGVLTEAIIRTEVDVPTVYMGLGKVIKGSRLIDFAKTLIPK